jgi:hypothetical protein
MGVMTAAQVHLVSDLPAPRPPRTGAPTVTPQHRPLTAVPSLTRLIAASVILGAPSAGAIWGSAAGLVAIGVEDKVAAPGTLPFCLDVLALGVVVVAMLFPAVAGRWSWKATPWLCYLFSGVLQVWEAWDLGPRAWGTHAAGLVAAAVGSHFILNLWETRAHAPVAAPQVEATAEPDDATPEIDRREPAVALASVTPAVRRPAARKPTRPAKKSAAVEPDPEVLAKVDAALVKLELTAHEATRDQILEHLRPGAPHATKVGAALSYRRDNP